jgi:hypothetical protein
MSTVFDDHSSNTERDVRDVIATGTSVGEVPSFYAAKSTYTASDPINFPLVLDTPPNVVASATWVIAVPAP